MASLSKQKQCIRKQLLERRNNLSTFDILKRSNQILAALCAVREFQDASTVLSYLSFGTEVNTHGCIRSMLSNETTRILVPVVADSKTPTLMLSELHAWNEIATSAYGILEPQHEYIRERPASDVDLALVPGIAFDRHGNRIGYGGGYYDVLLRRIEGKAVALAYGFQVLEKLPRESHDIQMDAIATEEGIIST